MGDHEVGVVTLLGRHASTDEYEPRCSCGWRGKRRVAGANPKNSWATAWADADDHVHASAENTDSGVSDV